MKLRSAVVGVGYLGNFHAQKHKALTNSQAGGEFSQDIEFVGVCDVNKDQANKVAAELNVQSFSDPKDLIGRVDLVSIATVTSYHYDVAKMFLENGIHVNVEKPITAKASQGRELLDLAAKKNLKLTVGHSERFNPAFLLLKKSITSPKWIELHRHAPYKARGADVSVLHDLMIHDLDLAVNLISGKPEIETVAGGKILSPTLDWASCTLKFPNGLRALITTSRVAPAMTRQIKVYTNDTVWDANLQTGDVSRSHIVQAQHPLEVEIQNAGKGDNLMTETKAFFNAVLGRQDLVISGQDALVALELVESIQDKIEKLK